MKFLLLRKIKLNSLTKTDLSVVLKILTETQIKTAWCLRERGLWEKKILDSAIEKLEKLYFEKEEKCGEQ
jgi:hypothetical protein